MTILSGFHQSDYRNFKSYDLERVQTQWQSHFPKLVSYNRFVEWIPDTLIPLCGYLRSCFGTCTGISFMDSTCLKVCHNRRINQHKVFKDIAARGKTSVDCLVAPSWSGNPIGDKLRKVEVCQEGKEKMSNSD